MFPDPTIILAHNESRSIPYMIQTGDTVIVAGVWQPHTVKSYADAVDTLGRVVFIEASPGNVERLSALTVNMPHVTWVNKALWREKTTLEFTINDGDYPGWNRVTADEIAPYPIKKVQSVTTIQVQADTLDNICEELGIMSVDHANLTINRAEFAALDGMTNVLEMNPDMRIYIATSMKRVDDMVARLNGLGFAVMTAIPPDKPSRNGKQSSTRRVYGIRR